MQPEWAPDATLCMVTIVFKQALTKLQKTFVRQNFSLNFQGSLIFFCKNAVLNICLYLKRFYAYKKIKKNTK